MLRWAFTHFEDQAAIASAFGAEGIAMLDIAASLGRPFNVFTLDTGYLFPETHKLITDVQNIYGIQVERIVSSLTPEAQESIHGPTLWRRDPNLCCQLRKIRPLRTKLSGMRAWITAIRRGQTPDRPNGQKVERDSKFGCIKINPLADWTESMVWDYIRGHHLAYNPLHDRNYPSIGCIHCTRPVCAGEDARAGRWPGFNKVECGCTSPRRSPQTLPQLPP